MKKLDQNSLEYIHNQIKKKTKFSLEIVVKSLSTGKDLTFKMNSSNKNGYAVFIGYEYNYSEFISCAVASDQGVNLFQKFKGSNSPSVNGAYFILYKLYLGKIQEILDKAEVFHTGNCLKCNRKLTDLVSIERGIGPKCYSS